MNTRYAMVGDAHVAYGVAGEGPLDLLVFMGEYMPIDTPEDEPRYARALRRLESLGRVIQFNRRGVALSDAPTGPLTQDQHVEDAVAVLDTVGSQRAVVFGSNVSGMASILFASQHPARTAALILVNTWARLVEAPDYSIGVPQVLMDQTAQATTQIDPGDFDWLTAFAPSVATDDRFRAWWVQAGNRGASPARSRELWSLLISADVRAALSDVTVPTLVVHRSGLRTIALGRYIAEHISGAKFVEVPGRDLLWWVGDSDAIIDEIETFIGGQAAPSRPKRKLATVLFLDVVASTRAAAEIGDRRWRDILGTYHDLAQREIERVDGRRVSTAGDGILATFEMPADAVNCAIRIALAVAPLGVAVRAGVHTGEIEIVGSDVAGIGVHIAARVMAAAGPGEVLVSRTVTDLVTGSGLRFLDRGEHELKGVPGRWNLFAVDASPSL